MTSIAEPFGETQDVAVTVLVDNRADLIVKSTETVKRFMDRPLLAEHGFAALIDLKDAGERILWDAGFTEISLPENLRRMKIDPGTITNIAISHGHGDHTAALVKVLKSMDVRPEARRWEEDVSGEEIDRWLSGHGVPVVAHPAIFRERWGKRKDGSWFGPSMAPPRATWEEAGARLILSADPYRLSPGCWTTGAVPRLSFEQFGVSKNIAYREGDAFIQDDIADDQAIVLNLKNKGLVIVAGCAHSGIINTIDRAREISGVDRVWGVIGGFHLARANDEEIQRTIEAMMAIAPTIIVPSHCTGFKAINAFANQMPGSFVMGVVGTSYLF